jgi:hypothetical protein
VAVKRVAKANETVKKQKVAITELRSTLETTEDELIETSKALAKVQRDMARRLEIKRTSRIGRRGGSGEWPIKLILMIIEMLVTRAPPSSIPDLLQINSKYLLGEEANEVPCVNFVRELRPVAQTLNEMLVAYALGNATAWKQLHTDGTGRRQTPMQNLIIRATELDGSLKEYIASSCIFAETETASDTCIAILGKVSTVLERFCDHIMTSCPLTSMFSRISLFHLP